MVLLTSASTPTSPATRFLADLVASVSGDRDLQSLLQRFLAPLVRLAGAQGGTVRVLHDDDDQLHLMGRLGRSAEQCTAGPAVDRHCGVCGLAADRQALAWTNDLSACRARPGSAPGLPPPTQRLLAVPLQHQGQVLGVYTLFFDAATEPSPDVLELLETVGALLGLALAHARQEAQRLSATLQGERQMMAADVHDGIAQSLTFVKMRLPLLQDAVQAGDLARAQQYLSELGSATSQAQASLRNILTQMRTPMDPLGLVHALESSVHTFRRSTSTELTFVNRLPDLKLPPEHEAQVYHLVQEALTNVARHAAARQAWLQIDAAAPGWVEVVIDDDGAGLDPSAGGGSHYGLAIMQDRAQRIGGSLTVGARPDGGTRVKLVFPCRGPLPGRPNTQEAR